MKIANRERKHETMETAPKPLGPLTEAIRRSMIANRSRDNSFELVVRSAFYRSGMRYRKHYRPIPGLKCEVDIAFTKAKLVVQLDGCFWHGCPVHGTVPVHNGEWWAAKLKRNRERDEFMNQELISAGWRVLRFWEHESTDAIVSIAYNEVAMLHLVKRTPSDAERQPTTIESC